MKLDQILLTEKGAVRHSDHVKVKVCGTRPFGFGVLGAYPTQEAFDLAKDTLDYTAVMCGIKTAAGWSPNRIRGKIPNGFLVDAFVSDFETHKEDFPSEFVRTTVYGRLVSYSIKEEAVARG